MSSIGIIPSVGLTGVFKFSGPFEEYGGVEMTVVADKSFDYYTSLGRNLLIEIYYRHNLTETLYRQHRSAGVRVISFRHSGNIVIDVPSSYITEEPEMDLGYRWYQFVVSLGILPVDIDLTTVKQVVKDALLNNMGINTEVLLSSSRITDVVSISDLEIAEQVRQNAVVSVDTPLKTQMMLERQVVELRAQVDHLMNILYSTSTTPPEP